MLSKTDIVQLKELAANKLSIRRISELTGFARNTISKYLKGAEPVRNPSPNRHDGCRTIVSGYDRNFSTAAATAPSSNAICRNKASGSV